MFGAAQPSTEQLERLEKVQVLVSGRFQRTQISRESCEDPSFFLAYGAETKRGCHAAMLLFQGLALITPSMLAQVVTSFPLRMF